MTEYWRRKAEELAQKFHETYERLAPEFSYKTREASAVPWDEVPENNKNLMIAVCEEIISQAEPDRKGLEECAREIRKIFVAAGEYDWLQQQKSDGMVIEILRTLAPECHIEAAAEVLAKMDTVAPPHVKAERFAEELRKHLRDAPEPSEDEENWASRVISDLKKIGDGDTILEIDEEGAVTDPKDAKLIKHLIACLRSLPKPEPVGEVGEWYQDIGECIDEIRSAMGDRDNLAGLDDISAVFIRQRLISIDKASKQAARALEEKQREIDGLRKLEEQVNRRPSMEPTPDE